MKISIRVCVLLFYLITASITFPQCDGRKPMRQFRGPTHPRISITTKLRTTNQLQVDPSLDSSNTQPYVSSPFTLPPFDSLPPIPLPENAPPFCIYPPFTPQPPSTSTPTPIGNTPPLPPPFYYLPPLLPSQSPPPSGTLPGPPQFSPSPPFYEPSPPIYIPTPPSSGGFEPSPPIYIPSPPSSGGFEPSPPSYIPSPPSSGGFEPSPPVFQPPVVYPPPTGPPPRNRGPSLALWCVAKPSVPDPIIQEAMNYACWSGADCASIQPDGSCFQPNTLLAHASYAFNSYWQRTKVAGGTCEFGGTGMLVTVDPSFDGCHFIYY